MPRYGDVEPAYNALADKPLWRALPAVAGGRVHPIRGAWVNTESFHATRAVERVARLLHPAGVRLRSEGP
jgi:ABC-type Fe3+-hydroxamate transport system substrate-binding protein